MGFDQTKKNEKIKINNIEYNKAKSNEFGYKSNKDIKFEYINGILIKSFRSIKNQRIELGRKLTLITGKNGTLKSSILGLIAHPFSPVDDAKDIFGNSLKTKMSDVFRLSIDKDTDIYNYMLYCTSDKKENIADEILIRLNEKEKRHRIIVSGNEKGDGNFSLNTSYINLKRLYPIIDTASKEVDLDITEKETEWIDQAYQKILQRNTYRKSTAVFDKNIKNTIAPQDSYYDYNSISSGEDNLGFIFMKLLSFERYASRKDILNGIICIDEIEASLHPAALINFFEFLLYFSDKFHIQIVFTTHSLYLIQYCLNKYIKKDSLDVKINNISTMGVANNQYSIMINPEYKQLYRELTYKNTDDIDKIYKINIICEDEISKLVIKRVLKERKFNNAVEFITNLDEHKKGNSSTALLSLAKNGKRLLKDSIIVVDADINIDKIQNEFLLKIPDCDDFAIEKRIIIYLLDLDGDDALFKDHEKMQVESTITDINININKIRQTEVKECKKWAKNNKQLFQKAITRYVKDNRDNIFDKFREDIIMLINKKREENFLPKL